MGEMGGARKRLEAAPGYRLMGLPAVRERDRVVALAPNQEGGKGLEEIQPIPSADPLSTDVDHRAQGLEERLAGAGLLKRPKGSGDRLQVDAPGVRQRRHHAAVSGQG